MDRLIDKIIKLLDILISRLNDQVTSNGKNIDVSAADYKDDRGFFIRVGTAGHVQGVYFDEPNDATTVDFKNVDGDLPHKLRIVKTGAGTTATDIVASKK